MLENAIMWFIIKIDDFDFNILKTIIFLFKLSVVSAVSLVFKDNFHGIYYNEMCVSQ